MFAAKPRLMHCALWAVVLRSLLLCSKSDHSLAIFSKFFQTALFIQASQPLLLDAPVPLLVIVTTVKCVG